MDLAKHLQVHSVPSTHCWVNEQGSTLEFTEAGDNPSCFVKQDRTDMPSRLKASLEVANLGLEAAVHPVPAMSCVRAFPALLPPLRVCFALKYTLNPVTSNPANRSVGFGCCACVRNSHQMNFQAALVGKNMRSR